MRHQPANPSTAKPQRPSAVTDSVIRAERMMQIAFILPAAVFIGWIGGVGLDRWLHQDWIYIVGILLGCVAGFIQIFRLVLGPENKDTGEP
jgi:F0F1-type ATP synthase assembly protein I